MLMVYVRQAVYFQLYYTPFFFLTFTQFVLLAMRLIPLESAYYLNVSMLQSLLSDGGKRIKCGKEAEEKPFESLIDIISGLHFTMSTFKHTQSNS